MIRLSFLNLLRRKSRTFLALLGIMIGVAALISLISVVDGLQGQLNDVISDLQGVWVLQKDAQDEQFSRIDLSLGNKLEGIPGVRVAVPEIYAMVETIDDKPVSLTDLTSMPLIYGVDLTKYYQMRGSGYIKNIEKGTKLNLGENGKVLLGNGIAEKYNKFVGSTIKINGEKFVVKGIFEATSSFLGGTIFMSLDDAKKASNFPPGKVNMFRVDLIDPTEDKKIASLINFKFDEVDAKSTSDLSEQMGSVLGQFRLMAVAVAGLAALVAAVGIVNTLLMSVLERFKEIGALRAVGWTASNVMLMVLLESIFIGVLGGILGIVFGFVCASALNVFFGLPILISAGLLAETFLFAVFLGLSAGLYPAFKASRMDPVQALRGDL